MQTQCHYHFKLHTASKRYNSITKSQTSNEYRIINKAQDCANSVKKQPENIHRRNGKRILRNAAHSYNIYPEMNYSAVRESDYRYDQKYLPSTNLDGSNLVLRNYWDLQAANRHLRFWKPPEDQSFKFVRRHTSIANMIANGQYGTPSYRPEEMRMRVIPRASLKRLQYMNQHDPFEFGDPNHAEDQTHSMMQHTEDLRSRTYHQKQRFNNNGRLHREHSVDKALKISTVRKASRSTVPGANGIAVRTSTGTSIPKQKRNVHDRSHFTQKYVCIHCIV